MTAKNLLLTCISSLFCINLSYAKWLQTDPKAEKYYATSPYAYCLNNPVKFIDPNGEEIHLYEVAAYRNKLPYFGKGAISNDRMRSIGGFEVSPYLDKNGEILGWSAYRDGRVQYVMDNPGDIDIFSKNVSSFGVAADLFYMNGTPDQGQIAIAAGDIDAGLLRQWGSALTSPEFYVGLAMGVVGSYEITKPTGVASANYSRFVNKMPANAKSTATWQLQSGGGYIYEATSAGKVPGSRAVYQKTVNSQGITTQMIKTTYDPKGNIVHIKPK